MGRRPRLEKWHNQWLIAVSHVDNGKRILSQYFEQISQFVSYRIILQQTSSDMGAVCKTHRNPTQSNPTNQKLIHATRQCPYRLLDSGSGNYGDDVTI